MWNRVKNLLSKKCLSVKYFDLCQFTFEVAKNGTAQIKKLIDLVACGYSRLIFTDNELWPDDKISLCF